MYSLLVEIYNDLSVFTAYDDLQWLKCTQCSVMGSTMTDLSVFTAYEDLQWLKCTHCLRRSVMSYSILTGKEICDGFRYTYRIYTTTSDVLTAYGDLQYLDVYLIYNDFRCTHCLWRWLDVYLMYNFAGTHCSWRSTMTWGVPIQSTTSFVLTAYGDQPWWLEVYLIYNFRCMEIYNDLRCT